MRAFESYIIFFRRFLLAVLIATLGGSPAFSDGPAQRKPGIARGFPGWLAAPDGKKGFIETNAGLEAIDLATGKTRWLTDLPITTLLVDRGFLLAARRMATGFTVVSFNNQTGKVERESQAVTFPKDIGPEYNFFALAALPAAGGLLVRWSVQEFYDGGAPRHVASAAGVTRFDLATGGITEADPAAFPAGAGPPALQLTLDGVNYSTERRSATEREVTTYFTTLLAKDAAGKILWRRALRTLVHLPPKP